LKNNADGDNKKIVFACHEIPFTVITQASLYNGDANTMGNTRNYPNGSSSLLGSHMNQLDSTENRGTYWISRLLEYFGCKLCIGGHKHTYALSYPIKENYQWVDKDNVTHNSLNGIKEMKPTLEDECGSNPENAVSWIVTTNSIGDNPYNVSTGLSGDVNISSTKLPYIPEELYNAIGQHKFSGNTYYYRCCTPMDTTNNKKYDGFVNYSMCQATGYKLKSNKELPCSYQVFSKLIPKTSNTVNTDGTFTDKVNAEQLYPMYSVINFTHRNDVINGVDVRLCRVTGIFKSDGGDSFTQTNYGKNEPTIQYLLEINSDNVDVIKSVLNLETLNTSEYMYGAWIGRDETYTDSDDVTKNVVDENKYLYIQY
jgi:hypothetical protein